MTNNMSLVRPDDIPEADFANYFCTYGYLYHQKEMLEDQRRMQSYYDSVFQNKAQFEGKVVLDVGTGSGILAIWAAMAGAKKVYAVEATAMATHARTLIEHNGVGDRVTVIQGMVEKIEIPEKVDIIISEWMGYFLLRESMLDSVLYARDKWLKPGGALYPSHCKMYLAPIRSANSGRKAQDLQVSVDVWNGFVQTTSQQYGVDLSCLSKEFEKEQQSYYMQTSQWCDVHPNQVLGPPQVVKELDLLKTTVEELKVLNEEYTLMVEGPADANGDVQVSGFCGWFDVNFRGSDENPADVDVELSTAPDQYGATHWGQQCFYLNPPALVSPGDQLKGSMLMKRNPENQRLLDVQYKFSHVRVSEGQTFAAPPRTHLYHIE